MVVPPIFPLIALAPEMVAMWVVEGEEEEGEEGEADGEAEEEVEDVDASEIKGLTARASRVKEGLTSTLHHQRGRRLNSPVS